MIDYKSKNKNSIILFRAIDRKWLEPFEGVLEFKKRITELKVSEVKDFFIVMN